ESWSPTQRTATFLLLDSFLDADMGALLDQWPVPATLTTAGGKLSDAECARLAAADGAQQDLATCLEWRVGRVRDQFRGDAEHWSHQLGRKLTEAAERARKGNGNGKKKGWGREKVEL
ncbi:hypothetical protein C8A05DRAFT_19459, partial [Staphylotrichum tortipilum]